MADLRERIAVALFAHDGIGASEFRPTWETVREDYKAEWLAAADAVLAELGLTQAEPVAWQYRRSPDSQWLPVCAGSALALVGDGDEYRPLYAAPQPQAEPVWQYRMATHPRGWIDTSAEDAARWEKGGFEVRCVYTAPQPQPQPLFLLHTGTIYGNERGAWDVEANSGKAVDAYCDSRPGQTIGLYPAPQPQAKPVGEWVMVPRVYTRKMMDAWNNTAHMTFDDGWAAILAAAPERPQPDWRHLWSECRRVMDKWHAQAVELGYDGVRGLLEKAAPQPQPQALTVALTPSIAEHGKRMYDRGFADGKAAAPQPQAEPQASAEDGMVLVQRADLAALEATDFGKCGWSARADLAARRIRASLGVGK